MPLTETAIHANLWRDLYVALSEQIENQDWAVRVYYKPFVRWIWLGALLMAFGGLVSASDPRYRRVKNEVKTTQISNDIKEAIL
jgi:cytochrome c-type biogenesis protein CcmF